MKTNQRINQDEAIDFEVLQAIERLGEAIEMRRKATGDAASEAEKMICIETRSLFVTFKDITLWNGLDDSMAEQVLHQLREGLKTLSVDRACINSVRRRVEHDFNGFIQSMRSCVAHNSVH